MPVLRFYRLVLGLVLLLGAGWGLSACQYASAEGLPAASQPTLATPSATPSLTATATQPLPTLTASVTAAPPPSRTPSPTPTPRGPLTWEQEARLYQASLTFLAESHEEATAIVRDAVDYLQGIGEDPSLACGPLSAAILRDAGLLPPDTDLHGFWLLDPRLRGSQIVLETYFSPERYEWRQFRTSTIHFDFEAFPLLPGDFLYLYAGNYGGSFEHMIVVTRVDEAGRAYTVSNLATEEGFVIRELMLYDPSQPGVGQFYDWLNRELNGWLGMTGDGGFDLWRPIAPVSDWSDAP